MSERISFGDSLPGLLELRVAPDLGELRRAVERDPAHELRRHVVLRRAPRLPDALVRFPPHADGALGLRMDDRPEPSGQTVAPTRVQENRVERGPEDVVLPLVEGAVADAHRTGACISGEVVERRLRQVAPPVDPVHDLQPAVVVRLDVGDELHELVGLPVEVQVVERLQRERRVPDPGVAVVPVPLSARRLREGRGERRHRRAGRHVRQPLDRQSRALDRVAPAVVGDARSVQPGTPEARRRREPLVGFVDVGGDRELLGPRESAVDSLAGLERVTRPHSPAFDAEREVGLEANGLSRARRVGGMATVVDQASTLPAHGRSRRRARR